MSILFLPLRAALQWQANSQQHARRNAMIACTSLAQRRAELDDVDRFLAGRLSPQSSEAAGVAADL